MPMASKDIIREETKTIPKNSTHEERPKEVLHDETPSGVTDHKFSPRGEWWTLCRICGLAQAAHKESEFQYYGDDILE